MEVVTCQMIIIVLNVHLTLADAFCINNTTKHNINASIITAVAASTVLHTNLKKQSFVYNSKLKHKLHEENGINKRHEKTKKKMDCKSH